MGVSTTMLEPLVSDQTEEVVEQAAHLERLLPILMRRLFALEPVHPVNDLPLAQLRICTMLQSGSRPISGISAECGSSISAATQIADRLEKSGLVERLASEEDRRQRVLSLTSKGLEWMRIRREDRTQAAARVLQKLPPRDREIVLDGVNRLLRAVGHSADGS